MVTLKEITKKIKEYNPNSNEKLIEKAYKYANKAHKGQKRMTGEAYINHPLEVANIITTMELDDEAICAAILHDVIEDTGITYEDIKYEFGEDIANLVEGVTKLGKLSLYVDKEEQQAENYRKFFMAVAKDIRVLMIKLADRLHNMRTLKPLSDEKKIEISKETMQIYAPLANRLGIYSIKWELEDLSFFYLERQAYDEITEGIKIKKEQREAFIDQILIELKEKLKEAKIEAEVYGRSKHLYSIYRKMQKNNTTLDQVYDLFALRIIVNSVKDCYASLGLVHELYKPMPRRFKDYIAMPKPNMYQSLHTTLIGPEGTPFEIQIRTWDMHRVAEYGIAAHWAYKEGKSVTVSDNKLSWLRESLEWQNETLDPHEFMKKLKFDLFEDEVFVFTPRGDIKSLPAGSTPIDFAYSIHEEIGHRMVGARVNSKLVPLTYNLKNGDIVDAITSENSKGPSRDWLKIVKTTGARNKIQSWYKKAQKDENTAKGKELIEKELKRIGIPYSDLFKSEWIEIMLNKYKYNTLEDCYAAIGFGAITSQKVITKMLEEYKKENEQEEIENKIKELVNEKNIPRRKVSKTGIVVKEIDNCLVKLSKCCNPLPGDEIIGYVTKGRGVSVHRADCVNCKDLLTEEERLIDVSWHEEGNASYIAELEVQANDRGGLLADITVALNDVKAKIVSINAKTTNNRIAVINIGIEVENIDNLTKVLKVLRKVDSVYEVNRSKNT